MLEKAIEKINIIVESIGWDSDVRDTLFDYIDLDPKEVLEMSNEELTEYCITLMM